MHFFSFTELPVEVMFKFSCLHIIYYLWLLKQSHLFIIHLLFLLSILGKFRCETIVADILDKVSGLVILVDGN